MTLKLKSLELQNTLPRSSQADLGCHKSLALDPSCLLTPPNTPQGMELSQSELEADLQEGAARQHRKGNTEGYVIQSGIQLQSIQLQYKQL